MHECLAVSVELANPYWFYPRVLVQRQTCRHAQPIPTQPALFAVRRRPLRLLRADPRRAEAVAEPGRVDGIDVGLAADLTDPRYDDLGYRQENFAHIQQLVEVFFLLQRRRRHLPRGPAARPADRRAQRAGGPAARRAPDGRGFFVPVDDDAPGGPHLYPGCPIGSRPWPRRPGRARRGSASTPPTSSARAGVSDDGAGGRGACAIAGIGTTDFSRDSGRSDLTLATQAVLAALDDAGLAAAEVDGIVRCDMDLVRHNDLAEALGIRQLSYWGECGPGGVGAVRDDRPGRRGDPVRTGGHGRGLPLAERAVGPAVRRRARIGGASRSSAAARPTTSSSCRTGCSRPARSSR